MTRILVVEDEPSLRTDLVDYLGMRGFAVEGVGSARELRASLQQPDPQPAIIILDIGLPDGNGFDLAREIRGNLDCGIIMLTALGEADDRVRGFDSGADIYLVKHSSLREIEATVNSLLRRLQDPHPAAGRRPDTWLLGRSSWLLQAPNRREVKLTATEFAFVMALLENSGQPCSRDALARVMARPQTTWDNRHLDAVVNRLRRKIREAAHIEAPIKMIYGRGYAFSAPGQIEA